MAEDQVMLLPELQAMIFEHIEHDPPTLLTLCLVKSLWFSHFVGRLWCRLEPVQWIKRATTDLVVYNTYRPPWKTVKPQAYPSVADLANIADDRRQFYANLVESVYLDGVFASSVLDSVQLPSLSEIRIISPISKRPEHSEWMQDANNDVPINAPKACDTAYRPVGLISRYRHRVEKITFSGPSFSKTLLPILLKCSRLKELSVHRFNGNMTSADLFEFLRRWDRGNIAFFSLRELIFRQGLEWEAIAHVLEFGEEFAGFPLEVGALTPKMAGQLARSMARRRLVRTVKANIPEGNSPAPVLTLEGTKMLHLQVRWAFGTYGRQHMNKFPASMAHLHNLQFLVLRYPDTFVVAEEHFLALSTLDQLRVLELYPSRGALQIDDGCIQRLTRNLPKLQYISWHRITGNLTVAALESIGRNCRDLRHLHMCSYSPHFDLSGWSLDEEPRFPTLRFAGVNFTFLTEREPAARDDKKAAQTLLHHMPRLDLQALDRLKRYDPARYSWLHQKIRR